MAILVSAGAERLNPKPSYDCDVGGGGHGFFHVPRFSPWTATRNAANESLKKAATPLE